MDTREPRMALQARWPVWNDPWAQYTAHAPPMSPILWLHRPYAHQDCSPVGAWTWTVVRLPPRQLRWRPLL